MKKFNLGYKSLVALLAAGASLVVSAAVTATWTGEAGDYSWATKGNWSTGAVPGSSDYVIFNTTPDQPITLNGSKTVADFFMSGCSLTFTNSDTVATAKLTATVLNGCGHSSLFLENGTLEAVGSNNTVAVQSKTTSTSAILGSDAVLKASDGGQLTLTHGKIAADAKNIKFIATGKQGTVCSKVNGASWYPATMTLTAENTGFSFEAYDGGIVNLGGTLNFVKGNDPVFLADGGQLTLSKAVMTKSGDLFVTNKNAGVTTLGAITGNATILAKDALSYVTLSGAIVGNSKVDCSDSATVKFSSTVKGNVAATCDNATNLFVKAVTGDMDIVCANRGVVWVQAAVAGATTIDASDKGIVKLVNSYGTSYQKITGATTISCADEGTAVQLAGFGNTGLNSSVKATDKGSVLAGSSLGNVALEADKGASVTLTSTMGSGTHSITCSNENSLVWVKNAITGNPTVTCKDKGTINIASYTGNPTILCAGEGSSVTNGNITGDKKVPVSITCTDKAFVKTGTLKGDVRITCSDGATVQTGTANATPLVLSVDSSAGGLVKLGAVTLVENGNSFVASNGTIQIAATFAGNKSFTSYYEVIGENGLIEGANVGVSIGSDSKTTVKLTPLASRSTPYIKTTTGGNLVFGAGVQYVIDVTEINKGKPFFGEKKILVAEAAGTLTYNAASSITTTGTDAEFYTASFEKVDKQLYLVLNCTRVPAGKVAVVGTEDFYDSLADALAAVPDNGLVAVLADSTVSATIANPLDKMVTLNVNGKTLTNAVNGHLIENFGTLILKGDGIYVGDNAAALVRNAPTGTLTIENGTFQNSGAVVDNEADVDSVGRLTVQTGSFTSTTATAIRNGGNATLSAGTYEATDCAIANGGTATLAAGTYTGACAISNGCDLTISSGTFTGSQYAFYNCCTATVAKGTFAGLVTCGTVTGDLTIKGGGFEADVAAIDGARVLIPGMVGAFLNTATFVNDMTPFCEDGFLTSLNETVYIVRRESQVVVTAVNADESKGTLTVEDVGSVIPEMGVTLRGTITGVTAGYVPVVAIGGQRVEVAQDGSFEGPAVDSAEVLVAYAKADAWFIDPFVRYTLANKFTGYSPIGTTLNAAESHLFMNRDPGSDKQGIAILDAQRLRDTLDPSFEVALVANAEIEGTGTASWRQIGPSEKYQTIFGYGYYSQDTDGNRDIPSVRYDGTDGLMLPVNWGAAAGQYNPRNLNDVVALGDYAYFLDDAAYAPVLAAHKFAIVANDEGCVTGLTYAATITGVGQRFAALTIGGKDYLYSFGNGNEFYVTDLAAGTTTTNVLSIASSIGTPRHICISGREGGTPHMTLQGDSRTGVWAMTSDAIGLVSPTPIAWFATGIWGTGGTTFATLSVCDDESRAFFAGTSSIRVEVLERKPANVIVRGTFSDEEHAEDDVLVAYGEAANVTFNAPTGKKITAVKINGVADTGFTEALSYTFADAALAQHVYVEMTLADQKFDVTLMNGDAAYYTTNIVYGTTVVKPADPTPAEGYVFEGWTNATYTAGFDFVTPITDDLTLHARYAVNGPKIEEDDTKIEVRKDDSQLGGNSYTVDSKDPAVTEVTFTSIDANAIVRVKPSITQVTGVEPANIVVLNSAGDPIPKAAVVGGTAEGYSTELNEEAKVPVTVNEAEVQIPVKPTIGEQIDGLVIETPFAVGDTTSATVAAVPGLTYELKSRNLSTGASSSIGAGIRETADATAKVTLIDDRTGGDRPTQEFYVIEVAK